jgi:hypothetical protein
MNRPDTPACVLFDSWYASLDRLKLLRTLGWRWLTQLRSNRRLTPMAPAADGMEALRPRVPAPARLPPVRAPAPLVGSSDGTAACCLYRLRSCTCRGDERGRHDDQPVRLPLLSARRESRDMFPASGGMESRCWRMIINASPAPIAACMGAMIYEHMFVYQAGMSQGKDGGWSIW